MYRSTRGIVAVLHARSNGDKSLINEARMKADVSKTRN
jgi:hypothetical protein